MDIAWHCILILHYMCHCTCLYTVYPEIFSSFGHLKCFISSCLALSGIWFGGNPETIKKRGGAALLKLSSQSGNFLRLWSRNVRNVICSLPRSHPITFKDMFMKPNQRLWISLIIAIQVATTEHLWVVMQTENYLSFLSE